MACASLRALAFKLALVRFRALASRGCAQVGRRTGTSSAPKLSWKEAEWHTEPTCIVQSSAGGYPRIEIHGSLTQVRNFVTALLHKPAVATCTAPQKPRVVMQALFFKHPSGVSPGLGNHEVVAHVPRQGSLKRQIATQVLP